MDIKTTQQVMALMKCNPGRTILLLFAISMFFLCDSFLTGYLSKLGNVAASKANISKDHAAHDLNPHVEFNGNRDSTMVAGDNNIIHNYTRSNDFEDEIKRKFDIQEGAIFEIKRAIDALGISGQRREALLEEQLSKYKKLETRLSVRSASNLRLKEASIQLKRGDFQGAEKIILRSMNRYLSASNYARALADARDLQTLRDLQIDRDSVKHYQEKVIEIESILKSANQFSSPPNIMNNNQQTNKNTKPYQPQSPVKAAGKEGAQQRRAYFYSESHLLNRYSQYYSTLKTLFNRIMTDHLLPEEALRVGYIKLNIIKQKTSSDPFSIWRSTDDAAINVSIRTLAFIDDICTLAAYLMFKYSSFELGEVYAVQVAGNTLNGAEGFYMNPLSACGLTYGDISDPEIIAYKEILFESALFFLITHEIGHFYYSSLHNQSIEEIEADTFALKTMYRSGCQPLGMSYIFPVMYWMYEWRDITNENQERLNTRTRVNVIIQWLSDPPNDGDDLKISDAVECANELKELTYNITTASDYERQHLYKAYEFKSLKLKRNSTLTAPGLRIVTD